MHKQMHKLGAKTGCANKRPDRYVKWEVFGQIFREGIYLGVSVGAHL